MQQWTSLTEGPEPCGRKLDFLLQEMNREVNTIGSKADGAGVPETVIGTRPNSRRCASRCRMSSSARRGRLFVVVRAVGRGQDDRRRTSHRADPRPEAVALVHEPAARPGETDGVDYNFVSRDRFEAMIAGGQFLEWAESPATSTAPSVVDTERELASGTDLVLVIEVQGARQVRRHRRSSVLVFLLPPSSEALESRLRGRGEDTEEQIRRRLDVAREEVRAVAEYDYVVINDEVEPASSGCRAIILAERARPDAMSREVSAVISSFGPAADRR